MDVRAFLPFIIEEVRAVLLAFLSMVFSKVYSYALTDLLGVQNAISADCRGAAPHILLSLVVIRGFVGSTVPLIARHLELF